MDSCLLAEKGQMFAEDVEAIARHWSDGGV